MHTSSGVVLVDGLTYVKHTYKNISLIVSTQMKKITNNTTYAPPFATQLRETQNTFVGNNHIYAFIVRLSKTCDWVRVPFQSKSTVNSRFTRFAGEGLAWMFCESARPAMAAARKISCVVRLGEFIDVAIAPTAGRMGKIRSSCITSSMPTQFL